MSKRPMARTWDGQPISEDPPYGVAVIVYRRSAGGYQFLLLHRARRDPAAGGDWAWTPPSGARYPGEPADECARRELREETGLSLSPRRTAHGSGDWWVYVVEASVEVDVRLSPEHDRYQWVSIQEAIRWCKPASVAQPFSNLARELGLL